MRRVKFTALTVDDTGSLRLGGEVFSGFAYHLDADGTLQSIDSVESGRVSGPSDDWLDLPEDGVRVDRGSLEMAGDYGPFLWRGGPVNGVVYSFDSHGVCNVEEAYLNGLPSDGSRRSWYASGAPWQESLGEDGSSWFEDGRLQSKGSGDDALLNIVVRDGKLCAIVLGDASLLDIESIEGMNFAEELLLIGPAIDTDLLSTLSLRTGLSKVTSLRLIETGASPDIADLLATFPNLSTLWLANNPLLGPDDAERIREALPNCTVHFEGG